MTKPWTESLAQSEISFMNEIIAQVPTDHGARETFITILQNLADAGEVKFRYIVSGGGDVEGTNNIDIARAFATDEEYYVVDVMRGMWLTNADESDDTAVLESTARAGSCNSEEG